MNENKDQVTNQTPSTNYDLKSDAVEKLLQAQNEEVPEFSKEELEKYTPKRGLRLPQAVKVILIKAWFYGAVCFFFLWGLGNYLSNSLDMLFVTAVAMGLVTDLLVNPVLRFMEKYPEQNNRWMLVTRKSMVGMGLNLGYGFVLMFCVYHFYTAINFAIVTITGATDTVPLGVEPIGFGLLGMGFDMLFISIKRLLQNILRDAKEKARNQSST